MLEHVPKVPEDSVCPLCHEYTLFRKQGQSSVLCRTCYYGVYNIYYICLNEPTNQRRESAQRHTDSLSERKQAQVVKLCENADAPVAHICPSNIVFSRKKRFPRALFPKALATGRKALSAHFTAIVPRDGEGYAVVVSKKTARLSVTRHSVKRRILSALRTLKLPPALIVFSRSALIGVHYSDIEKELADLLSKIN